MINTGQELLQSIKAVRLFFGDLGRLLTAADGLMDERGWEPLGDGSCLFWTSMNIAKGEHWIPRIASRHYRNAENFPRTVTVVTLLLDDSDITDFRLSEPTVSGSFFTFPVEIPEDKVYLDRWNACWFGYCQASLDGTPCTIDKTDSDWQASWRWDYMQVFGRPLVGITSQEVLSELIVVPLLKLVENHNRSVQNHP
jgi:hypothetical protein